MARTPWQEIIELLPSGIITLDKKGHVKSANPVAYDMLQGLSIGALWQTVFEKSFSPRSDDHQEVSLIDGRRVSIAKRPLKNELGQLLVLTDMTETRALQDYLNRQQRLAEMGEMTAYLAHQIRTPLATAVLYTKLLQNPDADENMCDTYCNKTLDSLNNIEHQIKDMLHFAKGERPDHEREHVEISDLFHDIADRLYQHLCNKGVLLNIEDCVDDIDLQCHRESLLGAIQNLIENAIQASEKFPTIDLYSQPGPENTVEIGVRDHGCGMSIEKCQKISKPFYTTKAEGTGLGLAVVQSVVKAHGGEVIINSREGFGTDVRLRFPCFSRNNHNRKESQDECSKNINC